MSITRRDLLAGTAAAAAAATLPGGLSPASAQAARGTLTIIPHASLTTLDPVATTGYIVRNHGYMIWDTLFAMNDKLQPQPQMASGYEVSADKLTYRITLRDGLGWHDGTDVTAEDCALSLIRWGKVDGLGRRLFTYVDSVSHDGAKTIVIKLKTPYGLVIESIGKLSTNVPFMMPKRFSEKPHTERLTADDMIGSGPFKWVKGEYRPGAQVVYERNAAYKPRSEPASGAAGGKNVYLERVVWKNFPDPTTALNALISGEVDYYEQVPADLIPIASAAPGVKIGNFNPLGNLGMARFNHLAAPSNNPGVRAAIVQAINQTDLLTAAVGNKDFFKVCHSIFPCNTTYESSAAADVMKGNNLEAARKLLKDSGYNGEKFVLLATTDIPVQTAFATVLADTMKKIGINVEAQAMDWATVLQRRASKNPVDQGGWNMFVTWWEGADLLDPVVQFALRGTGDTAWVGWSKDDEMEALAKKFAETADLAEKKKIADAVQARHAQVNFQAYLGQFFVATGYRDNVSGILNAPPFFWNIRKSGGA
jgi:peptide/nickel transport system substrate-binding protein